MPKRSLINDNNRKWWTLFSVCFALLMIVLDGNVVNLALPTIIKDFKASLSEIEWINNAYLLTFAIFLITFGRLGDEIGRKKMFSAGLVTFILGSVLCGIARNTDQLIIFRVIQGLGGASMMPATLSLIAANFKKEERGGAMGVWGAIAGLGIVLGPIVGGYLTDKGLGAGINDFLGITENWRYVFYINLPIGIVALLASIFIIKESKDNKTKHSYDFRGIILSSLSIFSLTFAFIEGAKYGWWKVAEPFEIFGKEFSVFGISIIPFLFLLFALLLVIFIWCEKRCIKDPLVDISLFLKRNFSVGAASTSILSFAMMGSFFLLPLFLQSILGYSPIETGRNLIPFAITIMIMSPISGKLADKFGGKYLIFTGLCIMAFGGWLLGHFRVDTHIYELILPFIVMGIGMGLCQAPLTNLSLLDIPSDEIGGASGVLSTTRQIGSVMGIAILGAVLQTSLNSNLSLELDKIEGITPNVKNIILDNAKKQGASQDSDQLKKQISEEIAKTMSQNNSQLQKLPATQAIEMQNKMAKLMKEVGQNVSDAFKLSFVNSINYTFRIAALIAALGALTSLFFRNKKGPDK